MSMFFNLGSIAFGLVAWGIPAIAISRIPKNGKFKNFSIYSFSSCTIALLLQLFEIRHRVVVNDFSAIMDTIGAVSTVSVILITVTILLNLAATCIGADKA